MLTNMGEIVYNHLYEIVHATADHSIRKFIFNYSDQLHQLCSNTDVLFLQDLELVNPSCNFPTTISKNETLMYGNIDDIGASKQVSEISNKYLFVSLNWLRLWNEVTRNRIRCYVGLETADVQARFKYIVANMVPRVSNDMQPELITKIQEFLKAEQRPESLFSLLLSLSVHRAYPKGGSLFDQARAAVLSLHASKNSLVSKSNALSTDYSVHVMSKLYAFCEDHKLPQVFERFADERNLWKQTSAINGPYVQAAYAAREQDILVFAQKLSPMFHNKTSLLTAITWALLREPVHMPSELEAFPTLAQVYKRKENVHALVATSEGLIKDIEPVRGTITSNQGDISLRQMLTDTYNELNIGYYFEKAHHEPNGHLVSFSNYDSIPFKDSLDYEYYLAHARPMEAFQSLYATSSEEAALNIASLSSYFDQEVDTSPCIAKVMDGQQITSMVTKTREIALLSNSSLVSSACVSFLELCGLDAQALRHDIQVLELLLSHVLAVNFSNDEMAERKKLTNLLLTIDKDQESKLQVMKLIEAAVHQQQLQSWQLICDFCASHNMPSYFTHVIDFARANQWDKFMAESQLLKLSVEQLVTMVKDNISDTPLQEHVLQVFDASKVAPSMLAKADDASPELSSIMNAMLAAAKKKPLDAVAHCLSEAAKYCAPILVVGASSMQVNNIPPSLFLYAWLVIYKKKLGMSNQVGAITLACNTDEDRSKLLHSVQDHMVEYCASAQPTNMHVLCLGWKVFDATNPLLNFVHFFKAFLEHKYAEAERFLRLFVSVTKTEECSTLIGKFEWIVATSKLLTAVLSKLLGTSYERMLFLKMLVESGYSFDAKYARLHQINTILIGADVEALVDMNVMEAQPNEIISKLISYKKFEQARMIASLYGLSKVEITREQAHSFVRTLQETPLWQYNEERQKAWTRIHVVFIEQTFEQDQAMLFFLTQLKLYYNTLPVEEVIALLNLALDWCKGTVFHPHSEVAMPKQKPCRSKGDIEMLEQNIALLQKCIQVNLSPLLYASKNIYVASIISAVCERFFGTDHKLVIDSADNEAEVSEFVSSIVDSLLMENKIHEAEKLCTSFKFSHFNLTLAKLAIELARGKLQVSQLPQDVLKTLAAIVQNEETMYDDVIQVLEAMHYVCAGSMNKGAKHLCKLVALNYKIGTALQISFDNIVSKDDYEILKLMIMCGKEMYKLCSTFITLRNLKTSKAAHVCADFLFSQFCEYYIQQELTPISEVPDVKHATPVMEAPRNKHRSRQSEEFSIAESFSSVESEVHMPHSAKKSIPEMATTSSITSTTLSPAGIELVTASVDEFLEFASMIQNPSELAQRLLKWIDEDVQEPPRATLKCRLELCIRAYWCFRIASNLEGIENLMKRIRESLVEQLIKQHEFGSLVDLIVSLRNYSELGYLFEILLKHEQFELILRKNTDKANQVQLNMVLASYLQTKYPNDDDKLMMVYLRFNMFSNLGNWYSTLFVNIIPLG